MLKVILSTSAVVATAIAASSSGCGQDAPFSTGELKTQYLTSSDKNRTYLVNLPDAYDSNVAAPLILSFHGSSRDAEYQETVDQFTKKSWNPNSIVVYPQGVDVAPYAISGIDDITFTSDLLSNLSSTFCIDESRIYCAGKSIGGGFCNMLACDSTMSASFAAIAPVAGAFYDTPSNESFTSNCQPSHQMPVLEFHGTDDDVIAYAGAEHNGVLLPSIATWAKDWAEADGCSDSDSPTASHFNKSEVLLATYSCNGSTNVVQHYAINDLAHIWPSTSSSPDNGGDGTYIDASPLILEFFGNWTLDDTTPSTTTSSSPSATSGSSSGSSTGSAGTTTAAAGSSTSSAGAAVATAFPGLVGAIALGALIL